MEKMKIKTYLKRYQQDAELVVKKILPKATKKPTNLHKAMRYAVLNGGKRLRSSFIYAIGESLNANKKVLDQICASIEFVHAYTLIHDDLPALDNDDIRRGKPSCHKAFGEATAILAGDALQALAFEVLANLNSKIISPSVAIQMIKELASTIGSIGLVGGEALDIEMENKKVSLKELKYTYQLKTGYLLRTAIILSILAGNCKDKKVIHHFRKFGDYIGLAFQVHDDIVGIVSDTKTLGKPQRSDELRNKPTYPGLLGLNKAKKMEEKYFHKAMEHLYKTKIKADKVAALAVYVIEREF